ncbi:MAG TPA: class I SAM-dependent methyltransferase [Terriglobales bacterium]
MSEELLHAHRDLWQRKPVLRCIYRDFYHRILAACQSGKSLEIGGGSGNLKEYREDVVTTDIVATEWLDAVADAQALPFGENSFDNIVAIDVLHHIEYPIRFLDEAQRVLKPRGRIVVVEPAISPVSWFFYTFCHPEPVRMHADPLANGVPDRKRKPFDSNQAIPTLLFGRHRARFEERYPGLKLVRLERFSFFAYPLSGGFRSWSLLPAQLAPQLLNIEERLAPVLAPIMSFRLLAVIENIQNA